MFKNKCFIIIAVISIIAIVSGCATRAPKNVLRVGICSQIPPYIFYHTQTNQPAGFDIDLAEELAKRLGKKLDVTIFSFGKLIFALKSNQIDCAFNMNITLERKEVVDFTMPIYTTKGQVVVSSDKEDIKTFEDIIDKKITIGIRNGTVYPQMLKEKYNVDSDLVKNYQTFGDLKIAIKNNMIDSAIDDYAAMYHLKEKEGMKIRFIKKMFNESPSGIIVDKNNKELLDELNKTLNDMIKDGTYDRISRKWFGINPLAEKQEVQ